MNNVIVNGANGRMGSESVAAINRAPDLNLVAALGSKDDLAACIKHYKKSEPEKPLVVLDFTNAEHVYNNTKIIIMNSACPVIGSSGLTESQLSELSQIAKKYHIGGLVVPNFSIGAVLMMQFSQLAARFFDQVEIIERHHPNKLDAPSGTAIRTAELINTNRNINKIHNNKSKETISGALGANYKNIPIHSLRIAGSVAHQTVLFGGNNETLSITHDSIHRECFMPGVIQACQKAPALNELTIGLESILDLKFS